MPRPESHRSLLDQPNCSNCRHSNLIAYKQHLLCFHGDIIEVTGHSEYPVKADHIELDGSEISLLDGDEYDRIWAGRVVDCTEVCDEWQSEPSDS